MPLFAARLSAGLIILGLFSLPALSLTACGATQKSSDFGRITSAAGQSFEVVSFGDSERQAEDKAVTAARLYCRESGRGGQVENQKLTVAYQGPFANAEQQKLAVGIMESVGDGLKYRKGLPIIGPSLSVEVDPKKTAKELAEDSFRATLLAVCRP